MFGNSKIEKKIIIEGMMCGHCAKKVEDVLSKLEGVKSVKVDLESKCANLVLKNEVDDETIKNAVSELDYKVTEIK